VYGRKERERARERDGERRKVEEGGRGGWERGQREETSMAMRPVLSLPAVQ